MLSWGVGRIWRVGNIRPNVDEVAIDEAGREGGHLKATTVTLPVFKSLSLTTLCGFLDFRNRAVCSAMSWRSQ